MRKYILKEYGSWFVMTLSYVTGLITGVQFGPGIFVAFIALALFINAKQALALWLRSKGSASREPGMVLLFQVVLGAALLLPIIANALKGFSPYVIVPALYLLLFILAGEHSLFTEIAGFSLLSLSALVGKFAASGDIDARLYLAVAVFFAAGVFRVRVQLRKAVFYRVLMTVYVAFSVAVYQYAALPVIALVPLADNLVFAATLYKVKVRVTGWIEVAKGLVFLVLMGFYY